MLLRYQTCQPGCFKFTFGWTIICDLQIRCRVQPWQVLPLDGTCCFNDFVLHCDTSSLYFNNTCKMIFLTEPCIVSNTQTIVSSDATKNSTGWGLSLHGYIIMSDLFFIFANFSVANAIEYHPKVLGCLHKFKMIFFSLEQLLEFIKQCINNDNIKACIEGPTFQFRH